MTAPSYANAVAPQLATPVSSVAKQPLMETETRATGSSAKSSIISQIQELSQPPPESLTLTAVLQLLEPLEETQPDVFLMTRSYVQNWLIWAYHQKVNKTESARVEEGIRLATERLGLATPRINMKYENPGPINSSILSMEGHQLLLRPNVTVRDGLGESQLPVPASLRRVKSLPEEVVKETPEGDSPEYDSLDFEGNQIVCCAVPNQFYEVSSHPMLYPRWILLVGGL